MSTTDVIKNYPFLTNIISENTIEFKCYNTKKYEDKYSFDSLMKNIKEKKDILEKKQKINYLLFKE
tara:strand:- start:1077 stop:1274 length:198 start_codon:yes stop_codon:yes gene_type:complete